MKMPSAQYRLRRQLAHAWIIKVFDEDAKRGFGFQVGVRIVMKCHVLLWAVRKTKYVSRLGLHLD